MTDFFFWFFLLLLCCTVPANVLVHSHNGNGNPTRPSWAGLTQPSWGRPEQTLVQMGHKGSFVILRKLSQLKILLYCRRHVTGSASAPVIPREEQFEDYGEGVDVDFSPSSPCPEDDSRTNGFSDLGSSLPSRFVNLSGNTHTSQSFNWSQITLNPSLLI